MKPEHKAILSIIEQFLEKCPEQRFGQALFNLGINEFTDKKDPQAFHWNLRDIYNDKDGDILGRIIDPSGK